MRTPSKRSASERRVAVPRLLATLVAAACAACAACSPRTRPSPAGPAYPPFPADYRCVPFHDAVRRGGPQTLPGRLQNEWYDMPDVPDAEKAAAAEGACYHDSDARNSGSGPGALNGTGSYLREFRMHESADISYTKLGNPGVAIDDSPYDLVTPAPNSLYLGWIEPGEWVRYTVSVRRAGWYTLSTMYTSKSGGHISLDVNGRDATGPLALASTFAAADTVEWRQAHHWNRATGLGPFYLPAGRQVLTLHFLDRPVFNFDYMDFAPAPAPRGASEHP